MRVVSLVPSSTETLLALGAEIVACTKFCEQPGRRHVGGTKNPDIEAIIAIHPDVVVLDREENRREDADSLVAAGLSVFVSEITTIGSAIAVVRELAELIGAAEPSIDLPEYAPIGMTTFVPIWRRPWMSIGDATYGGALLEHLGCRLVTCGSSNPYPTVTMDEVASMEPDIVLVPSEPYEFSDEHLRELIDVVPNARMIRVDGRDLFWWGTRTPGAVHRLHDVIRAAVA